MRRVPVIANLNGGEMSPLLSGRVDVEKIGTGEQTLENFIPKLQGPLERRGGSLYMGPCKPGVVTRIGLPRFFFNEQQAYALEMGSGYLRFWTQRGQLQASGGGPYELAHTYNSDDLFDEDGLFLPSFVQSRDVMIFAAASQRPKVLSRLSATNWTWTDFDYFGGPFIEENETDTTLILSSAVPVGSTTVLTASSPLFQTGVVGQLIELRGTGQASTPPWTPGVAVGSGVARQFEGRYYVSVNAGTTGTVPPTHSEGDVSDGAVIWHYAHANRTVVRIEDFDLSGQFATVTMMTWATGDVVNGLGAPVTTWSWGAWSDFDGWPTKVGFFRDRLVFARGTTLWFSAASDYSNFAARTGGEILQENAIGPIRLAVGRADEVRWLQADGDVLLAGTVGGIVVVGEMTTQTAFGPGNVKVEPGPAMGASQVVPLETSSGQLLYIDRTRTGLRAVSYSSESETFSAPDITRLAEHILDARVIDIVYQAHLDSMVWCLLQDGSLAALTWDADEGVFAWSRHAIAGGTIQAICVIPYPFRDRPRDDLWMIVRRERLGAVQYGLELLEAPYLPPARQIGQTIAQWRSQASATVKYSNHVDGAMIFDGIHQTNLLFIQDPFPSGAVVQIQSGEFAFDVSDINQIIQHDYVGEDGFALTAEALITDVATTTDPETTNISQTATCTIIASFPFTAGGELSPGQWRLTTNEFTGLDHLEGRQVAILADGSPRPRQIVINGRVEIDRPTGVAHIGLPFQSKAIGNLREVGAIAGTSQGRLQRTRRLMLRVFAGLGMKAGMREEELEEVQELKPWRDPLTPLGVPNPLFFGDAVLPGAGGYDRQDVFVIAGDEPLPFTLTAVVPDQEVS
jgi:hypothetical protein